MTMRLSGQVCIVTGAAGGIGSCIARRLGQEGAYVCIADVNMAVAQKVVSQLETDGSSAFACFCDVTDRSSVRQMIAETARRFGQVNVIFNNAGISQTKHFFEIEEAEWERIMRVNALGVLLCTQEAARQMIMQGRGGKIINTGSIAGKQGYPLFAHYSASKFAVIALTQAAARDLATHKITVNAFCPGVVATELWQQLDREFLELGETQRQGQALEEFSTAILLGRVSIPEDIAGLAVFLASHESDYITGQSIMVDGGMVLL